MDEIARLEARIEKTRQALQADEATLAEKRKAKRAEERAKERKRDTRRKVIVGAVLLKALVPSDGSGAQGAFRRALLGLVDRGLAPLDRPVVAEVLPELTEPLSAPSVKADAEVAPEAPPSSPSAPDGAGEARA